MRGAAATIAACAALVSSGAPAGEQSDARSRAEARGAAVYLKYCALCHGEAGDGRGRAASLHRPPPVDLTRSTVNDQYRALIIRLGSQAVGRSDGMPPWKDELTDAQIRDVIAYIGALSSARR